jgi:hypothetical protein
MVSRLLAKLDAQRHFTSGSAAAWARDNVGINAAPAATPAPADFKNFLRSMIAPLGIIVMVKPA